MIPGVATRHKIKDNSVVILTTAPSTIVLVKGIEADLVVELAGSSGFASLNISGCHGGTGGRFNLGRAYGAL